MPVSRHRRVYYCPGCNLRCYKGSKRLKRHMKNQCSSRKVRASNQTHKRNVK